MKAKPTEEMVRGQTESWTHGTNPRGQEGECLPYKETFCKQNNDSHCKI